MKKYNHKKIEPKWQKKWEEDEVVKIDKNDTSKEKFYILDMFPYPSGDGLHMGHTESYTSTDIIYRYKRMKGFNVLHPQGFDAFGLPAENYAIKTKVHPKETTKKNIENYIRQMKSLGFGYDFDEKIVTSSQEYYKWTQWIFTKFFEAGLAYKKTDTINWCESCKTGLANEQVEDGKCERCKNDVEQKEVPGWFLKITDFADELIEGLKNLDWPEHTKKNQINWIGKSEGAEIDFSLKNTDKKFTVFTTRPDTLFGATYCVLAPEHNLVSELKEQIENLDEVEKYLNDTKKKTERERLEAKEKTGVELKGVKAINPANNEEIPIFIADYVLARYGTGAIMAVPAHDERDFEFAKKFRLPTREVIAPSFVLSGENAPRKDFETLNRSTVSAVIESINGDEFLLIKEKENTILVGGGVEGNETPEEAILREIREETGYVNVEIKDTMFENLFCYGFRHTKQKNQKTKDVFYHVQLKDDERVESEVDSGRHGIIWLKKEELSENISWEHHKFVWSSFMEERTFTNNGIIVNSGKFDGMESEEAKKAIVEFVGGKITSNYRLRDWSVSRQRYWGTPIPIVYDPEGGAHHVPEEHLPWALPEDVDFVPTGISPLANSKELKERTEKIFGEGWTPEVDTLDTFVDSSWYFLRYPNPHNEKQFISEERLKHWLPVDLYIGGAEHTYMHLLYARFATRAMHKIGLLDFSEPFPKLRHQGMVLDKKGVKMSKSKGNVVNPDEMVERFGADATRMYAMFASPLDEDVIWNENGVVGTYRFLERVWKLQEKVSEDTEEKIESEIHKVIKKVGDDLEKLKFNTAIASMMSLMNNIAGSTLSRENYEYLLKILAPFAPHITDELWQEVLGNGISIHLESWPKYNEEKIKENIITIVVQVNGKVRAEFVVDAGESEEKIKNIALEQENVTKWIDNKEPKKIIYVKNKLVNIVV